MTNKKVLSGFLFLFIFVNLFSQSTAQRIWNNRKCAVALTYDDGLNVHLDKVIPVGQNNLPPPLPFKPGLKMVRW